MTSFKVAQLLASAPRVRNVLFIVDRVDLIDQTLETLKTLRICTLKTNQKVNVNLNEN